MKSNKKDGGKVLIKGTFFVIFFLVLIVSVFALNTVPEPVTPSSGTTESGGGIVKKNVFVSLWDSVRNIGTTIANIVRGVESVTASASSLSSFLIYFVVGISLAFFIRIWLWIFYHFNSHWPFSSLVQTGWFGFLYIKAEITDTRTGEKKAIPYPLILFCLIFGFLFVAMQAVTFALIQEMIGGTGGQAETALIEQIRYWALKIFFPLEVNGKSGVPLLGSLIFDGLWFIWFPSIVTFFWKNKKKVADKSKKNLDDLKRKIKERVGLVNARDEAMAEAMQEDYG